MIKYRTGVFFKKWWYWFVEPVDVIGVDMVNFFSYADKKIPGFSQKKGWTTVIDLKKTEEEIWQSMRKGFVQEQIKRGESRGIKVVRDKEYFSAYAKLDKEFRKRRQLPSYKLVPFKNYTDLYVATLGDKLLAGSLVISDGQYSRALVLSSAHGLEKDLQNAIGQANRMIMWEMIKVAKQSGCQLFDLGGLDMDKDGQLTSLGEFKEAFGGERKMTYFYYKVYNPLLRIWMKVRRLVK